MSVEGATSEAKSGVVAFEDPEAASSAYLQRLGRIAQAIIEPSPTAAKAPGMARALYVLASSDAVRS